MLKYITLPVTRYRQNCSVIWCDVTQDAAVVDPGGDLDKVLGVIASRGLHLNSILLTHAHIDHVGGVGELRKRETIQVVGPHRNDKYWLDQLPEQSKIHNFPFTSSFEPDRWLEDADLVKIGNSRLAVHHCPGHTPGHVVFHASEINRAFVGDVLFVGGIGRTDLPGGNHDELVRSIRTKIWPMGNNTVFIPGHGPEGHIGQERMHNPYVGEATSLTDLNH
jgi:hydroxyacylglutathione hydrolase